MYIKGISKVLIVITILLSVFLVTPSKVEAQYTEARLSCPSDSIINKGGEICCPTLDRAKTIIMKRPNFPKDASGVSFTSSYTETTRCEIKYKFTYDSGVTSATINTAYLDVVQGEYKCPLNSCEDTQFLQTKKCISWKSMVGSNVCCLDNVASAAKGGTGKMVPVKDCKFLEPVFKGGALFNQEFKEITADEICTKDSGIGNADDKRSDVEKKRIYKECSDCINLPNKNKTSNIWTGVGCMEASLNGVITTIIRIFYGIITAIMLLKIIIAGYKYYGGDPEQLKDSKMEIFSAIGAAFALTLGIIALRYIGIDILGLGAIDGVSTGLPILK